MTPTQLIFEDPAEPKGRSDAGAPQKDPPLTVGQLAGLVKQVLSNGFPKRIRVVGEVSNFSSRTHWFFSLKDDQAAMSCVCFASAARAVRFPVADGLQVVASGRVDYYEAHGRIQLYVDKLELIGAGELELRFRALCEELRNAGYFDPMRKKPLPMLPRTVAVVTSRNAAALQDVINTSGQRWGGCRLMLFDVHVQGPAAAPQIAQALRVLSDDGPRLGIDAIILTRGGGSIEDLWAFNERVVADAVHECRLPIVAAIGHETDTTVAELVADLRCATPTQAAMTLIPDRSALTQQVDQYTKRLTLLLKRTYEHERHRLEALRRHPIFRHPQRVLQIAAERLDTQTQRLRTALPRRIDTHRNHVEALGKHLESVGPRSVLNRGYSYTIGEDGKLLRRVRDAKRGDLLTTVLSDGRVNSRVEKGGGASPSKPRSRRKARSHNSDDPGLFESNE